MDSIQKIQQMTQILCDAEQDVWSAVSKMLHTHSQVTGLKIDCCDVNSTFNLHPVVDGLENALKQQAKQEEIALNKVVDHIWIPIDKVPDVKDKAHDPIAKKLTHHALIKYGLGNHEATVVKCNKLTVEVYVMNAGYTTNIPYWKVKSVSSSMSQHIKPMSVKKNFDKFVEKYKIDNPEIPF